MRPMRSKTRQNEIALSAGARSYPKPVGSSVHCSRIEACREARASQKASSLHGSARNRVMPAGLGTGPDPQPALRFARPME